MVKLNRIVKDYRESGAVNAFVNLFGFVDEQVFLTKSGEVGLVLKVQGRDYECLDPQELDHLTRRFEAAVRSFDPNFRLYQYLIKRDSARIPHRENYDNRVVQEAVLSRAEYLEGKAEQLYTLDIYFVVLYEGFRQQAGIAHKLKSLRSNPLAAFRWIFHLPRTNRSDTPHIKVIAHSRLASSRF